MHDHASRAVTDQDTEADLAALMERAAQAMERMGITAQDFLNELPIAQTEVLHEIYGPAYMQEIERRIAAYRQKTSSQQPTAEG